MFCLGVFLTEILNYGYLLIPVQSIDRMQIKIAFRYVVNRKILLYSPEIDEKQLYFIPKMVL